MSPRTAVTAVFFLNGAVFAAWYSRVPAIQDDLGIGPGALGLALLGAPAGLLVAQPLVGAVAARRGSRPIVRLAPLLLATVVLPAVAVDTLTLLLALVVVGAANGAVDVSMNIQGLAVERTGGRPIFASLHAAFSFGALAGAGIAAVAAAAGADPLPHLAVVAVVGGALGAVAGRGLLDDREQAAAAAAPRFARPSGRLLGLGALGFCALLAEGSVFDWSGIYLDDEAGAAAGLARSGWPRSRSRWAAAGFSPTASPPPWRRRHRSRRRGAGGARPGARTRVRVARAGDRGLRRDGPRAGRAVPADAARCRERRGRRGRLDGRVRGVSRRAAGDRAVGRGGGARAALLLVVALCGAAAVGRGGALGSSRGPTAGF